MKLHKTNVDKELYYYFNAKNEKRWIFRHRYYDALGKRRERSRQGFTSERIAYRELLKVKAETLSGNTSKIENENLTVSQWLDIWYDAYHISWEISSKVQRKSIIKQYMKPRLGKYKLSSLDRATYISEYINKNLETLKPSTVLLHHRIFSAAINAAVEDEIIPRNRFTKISIQQNEQLENFLTPNELDMFLNFSKKHSSITEYTMILTLAYSGIRHGECLGLTWKNINFEENTITIELTKDHFGARTPKTANSYRTISVDEIVMDQLKKYKTWCVKALFKHGKQLDERDGSVFIDADSEPCTPERLRRGIEKIYDLLEKKDIKIREITPHGLRHSHATVLISKGIPPKTVADRLGNTVEMVLRIYSHSYEDLEEKAVKVFSESLSFGGRIGAG